MSIYEYKARDKFGKSVTGLMGAVSDDAVANKLKETGYIPVSIELAKEEGRFVKSLHKLRRVKISEIYMFTRQFAALQHAGLPILLSLNALREQSANMVLKYVIKQIIKDIEAGLNLSSALEKHPKIFNALYVNMIKCGEASGNLDEVLERLATLEEYDERIRLRIQAATRYPIIVVVAITLGFLFLTTFIVPRFAQIYGQFTVALPLPTQLLLLINYLLTHFWWLLILIVAASVFACNQFIKTKNGRLWWDTLKLKMPIFGPFLLKLIMSRFARITGTLMRSGVPLLRILELASSGAGNVVVARIIDNIKASVIEGKGMVEPMRISGVFPPIVTQMISVGEDTGKVDELLMHVSNHYDAQVDYTINNLVSLIEPILIFVLGCMVLFMALGMFLPMWNLMSLFR